MTFVAWYALIVGVGMILQWGVFLGMGMVPEVQTEPTQLAFHLAGEVVTAVALIVGGEKLLRETRGARRTTTFALGMLAYTVIVSPGYFAQRGTWPLVGMLALLLVLDGIALWMLWRRESWYRERESMGGREPERRDARTDSVRR